MSIHNDLLGMALNDFQSGRRKSKIIIHSPDFDKDEINIDWYFRSFEMMPVIEQEALSLCRGEILEAGAGAGSHALYLQEQGKSVTALDISGGACEVMRARGISRVVQGNIYAWNDDPVDTLLMMMNGIGLCESIQNLDAFLLKLPQIVKPGGQFIFDSTNLIYLFQDEHSIAEIDLNADYYGEIQFRMEYDGYYTPSFKWLYVDFDTLKWMAENRGLEAEKILDGENYHYLARILV